MTPRNAMTPRHLVIAGLLLAALLPWLPAPQQLARATLDQSLDQAFAAFAIAKGLNATISVLQSSTVDLQVFQITPGELLGSRKPGQQGREQQPGDDGVA